MNFMKNQNEINDNIKKELSLLKQKIENIEKNLNFTIDP